jgi:hypothetical protein
MLAPLRRSVLIVSAAGILAPTVLCAGVSPATVECLNLARNFLTTGDTTVAVGRLQAVCDTLNPDPSPDSKIVRRRVQYVMVNLKDGDVHAGTETLQTLIDDLKASPAAPLASGIRTLGRHGHPPVPHGAPPVHHWPHPPVWWRPIPVPVLVPAARVSYAEGFNYGLARGYFDGWNNLLYNVNSDPLAVVRPDMFRQGFQQGYARAYSRAYHGQPL